MRGDHTCIYIYIYTEKDSYIVDWLDQVKSSGGDRGQTGPIVSSLTERFSSQIWPEKKIFIRIKEERRPYANQRGVFMTENQRLRPVWVWVRDVVSLPAF